MTDPQTALEPGFYWTRSTDRRYPGVSISEWNGKLWHSSGVSAASEPNEIEVLTPRLIPPRPYDLNFGPFGVNVGNGGDTTMVFCNRSGREAEDWNIEWHQTHKVAHSDRGLSFIVPDKQIAKLKVKCHHDEIEVTL